MTIRDERQEEFAERWLESNRHNILNICPRGGKCKIGINIMKKFDSPTVLICYPDEKIKKSWEEDFLKWNYNNPNIIFTTYLSLYKYRDFRFDLIILDEVHTLSEAQINVCKYLFVFNKQILALTGTLSKETALTLKKELSLNVEAVYSIEQAIKEGVISNYEIEIVKIPLDDKIIQKFKKPRTEKKQFDALTFIINKLEDGGKDTFFLRLTRMRLIQNSISKLNKTKEFIIPGERTLVFCGTTKLADSLGIPSFHNKTKDKELFNKFVNGEGEHLALCKIGNTGVTFLPLSRIIFSAFDSNEENFVQKLMRAMSFEYNNPEKITKITIITSNEDVELEWLRKALKGMNKDKIKYI